MSKISFRFSEKTSMYEDFYTLSSRYHLFYDGNNQKYIIHIHYYILLGHFIKSDENLFEFKIVLSSEEKHYNMLTQKYYMTDYRNLLKNDIGHIYNFTYYEDVLNEFNFLHKNNSHIKDTDGNIISFNWDEYIDAYNFYENYRFDNPCLFRPEKKRLFEKSKSQNNNEQQENIIETTQEPQVNLLNNYNNQTENNIITTTKKPEQSFFIYYNG